MMIKNLIPLTLLKKISNLLLLLLLFSACNQSAKNKEVAENIEKEPVPKIEKAYGFVLNDYIVVKDTIEKGDSFGDILISNGLNHSDIYKIVEKVRDTFDPRRIVIGDPYVILKARDSARTPKAFIYENNMIDYTVINLKDSISVFTGEKPVTIKTRKVSGVITSSLSAAIEKEGLDYAITNKLNNIYQWSIDFFRLQEGDRFKLVFQEKYIDDTIYAGIKGVKASLFVHDDTPFYAFNYELKEGETGYYDEEARPLESFFLKAPLNFTRISSRFSPRRFHPVQKRWKAHKGTDYAAPHGTPIWSTADGVVIASSYTGGNGNYVKIRHNSTYTTQYLHMSKRNVRKGQRVKQGDIIGFVGSTGLATGPHVCYRFWVNGVQRDPYKQILPEAEPIEEAYLDEYFAAIKPLKKELAEIQYTSI